MLYDVIIYVFISAVLPWHQFAARLQETKDPLKVRLLVIVIDDDVVLFLVFYFCIIFVLLLLFFVFLCDIWPLYSWQKRNA